MIQNRQKWHYLSGFYFIFKLLKINMNSSSDLPQQPELLLQLRQKAQNLRQLQTTLKEQNKLKAHELAQYSDELNVLLREKELQERKSKSLILLVTDIKRQVDDCFMENYEHADDDIQLEAECKMLRQLLVKMAERVKEDQKLLSFLRQASNSGPKAAEFIQRSQYLEGQTELLTKLRSQISSFSNSNLECTRKWNQLNRQTQRLMKEQSFFKIQNERLKTELKQNYQGYLQSLNRSKASLVNFNQTQREKVIAEHLVEEVALLQQNRLNIQQQNKNLKYHQETLLQQNARIQMENRQLKSFFMGQNGQQQQRLATKMKARVQQLRDSLIQIEKLRTLPQLPFTNLSETVRSKLRNLQQSQKFIQMKIREQQQGKMVLEQKDVVSFFEAVLRSKDQKIQIAKEKQYAMSQKMKQISIKRQLLENQIGNLSEGLKYHHYQNTIAKINYSSVPYESQFGGSVKAEGVSKWRDRKMVQTNLATTTSKYLGN